MFITDISCILWITYAQKMRSKVVQKLRKWVHNWEEAGTSVTDFGVAHIKQVAAEAVRRSEITKKEGLKHNSWKWREEDKAQKATKPLGLETVRLEMCTFPEGRGGVWKENDWWSDFDTW